MLNSFKSTFSKKGMNLKKNQYSCRIEVHRSGIEFVDINYDGNNVLISYINHRLLKSPKVDAIIEEQDIKTHAFFIAGLCEEVMNLSISPEQILTTIGLELKIGVPSHIKKLMPKDSYAHASSVKKMIIDKDVLPPLFYRP